MVVAYGARHHEVQRASVHIQIAHDQVLEYQTEGLPVLQQRGGREAQQRHGKRRVGKVALGLHAHAFGRA